MVTEKTKWILKTVLQGRFLLAYRRATYKTEWEKWFARNKFAQNYPTLYKLKKWYKRTFLYSPWQKSVEELSKESMKELKTIRSPHRPYPLYQGETTYEIKELPR